MWVLPIHNYPLRKKVDHFKGRKIFPGGETFNFTKER